MTDGRRLWEERDDAGVDIAGVGRIAVDMAAEDEKQGWQSLQQSSATASRKSLHYHRHGKGQRWSWKPKRS